MKPTCQHCNTTYTGYHCGTTGCHQTFTTIQAFDNHRHRGKCTPLDPNTQSTLQ